MMRKRLLSAGGALLGAVLAISQPLGGVTALAAGTDSADIAIELPAELDAASYADQWIYIGEADLYSRGEPTGETTYAGCYALKSVVYCANPADADVQVLDIFVPEEYVTAYATGEVNEDGEALYHVESSATGTLTNSNGTTYESETAPILYQNMIDGYKEGELFEIGNGIKGASDLGTMATYLREGYVVVGIGTRGTDSEVDGTAPAGIVDLKAGVRFLKANDAVLPGDSDRIYATGVSAGGGSVCVLGATGNSTLYNSYLEEIGAIMESTDDIYGVLAYCPITNFDFVDSAFEWLHSSETTYSSWGGVENTVDETLHEALITNYETYLQAIGFDLDAYEAGFVDEMNEAVAYYIENYVDDVAAFVEEYSDSLTYDADGNVVVISKDAFIEANMGRGKGAPASDAYDADSNESALFDGIHFSITTESVLESIGYDELAAEYLADITDEQLTAVILLSPMSFLVYDELESDVAPVWRINNGTADGDFGSVTGYTIVSYLNENDLAEYAEFNFVWGKGHATADLSMDDIVSYIDSTAALSE